MITYIAIIVISALIAALNPVTSSVVIMSLTSLSGKRKSATHRGLYTCMFAFGMGMSMAVIATAAYLTFSLIHYWLVALIGFIAAVTLSVFGLLEIKDYFWYGRGLSFKMSARAEHAIHEWTKTHHGHGRAFMLGAFVSLHTLHYVLVMIVGTMALLYMSHPYMTFSGFIWAFWYTLPLLFVAALTASGMHATNMLVWKEDTKHTMRLSIGLLYIAISWLLFAVVSGGIRLA